MLYCFLGGRRCSGALGGESPHPLQRHGLLAAPEGTGSADGSHAQVQAGACSCGSCADAAEGGLVVLADDGPHVGGGQLSLAGSPLHDDHRTFAIGHWLHAHRLAVNQPMVAEGVAGLQIIGPGAGRLHVPFDEEVGAVAHHYPLQMRRHGDSSSGFGSGRQH